MQKQISNVRATAFSKQNPKCQELNRRKELTKRKSKTLQVLMNKQLVERVYETEDPKRKITVSGQKIF
jgi:hypothetical protein